MAYNLLGKGSAPNYFELILPSDKYSLISDKNSPISDKISQGKFVQGKVVLPP
jgi:hypothetical protein